MTTERRVGPEDEEKPKTIEEALSELPPEKRAEIEQRSVDLGIFEMEEGCLPPLDIPLEYIL
jgi:hypothetical protein